MNRVSRRALARYAADQLLAGKPARSLGRQLAAVMAEAGQQRDIEFLLDDTAAELERRRALSIGRVTSATPLNTELRSALRTRLKKVSGAPHVLLEETVDKLVIGGVRIETSTGVWDSTVARKLSQLKEAN